MGWFILPEVPQHISGFNASVQMLGETNLSDTLFTSGRHISLDDAVAIEKFDWSRESMGVQVEVVVGHAIG